MRSTARPTTLGTCRVRRAAHRAVVPPPSPPASCRWNSARISADRCVRRRISAASSRIYRELLSAFFSADIPPEARERIEAAAKTLSADDQGLAAEQLRGSTISHPDWIRKSRIRGGLRARWLALFQDVNVMLCPPMPTVAFPHDHSPQFARKL